MSSRVNGYVFDDTTGKIKRTFTCTAADVSIQASGPNEVSKVGEADQTTQYVALPSEVLTARVDPQLSWDKLSITADGVDFATLTSLGPASFDVMIERTIIVQTTDGLVEFSAVDIGDYHLMFDEVQYLKQEWIINAS